MGVEGRGRGLESGRVQAQAVYTSSESLTDQQVVHTTNILRYSVLWQDPAKAQQVEQAAAEGYARDGRGFLFVRSTVRLGS